MNHTGNYNKPPAHVPYSKRSGSTPEPIRTRPNLSMSAAVVPHKAVAKRRGGRSSALRGMLKMLLLGLLLAGLAGCGNVGQKLITEREAFNAALSGIHAAHVAGALPAAKEREMLPYLEATKSALDAGDAAYLAGDHDAAGVYLRAATTGLTKLSATTKPSVKP